ncbi:hypothetical protein Droror1_Dr00017828 [Drosera rotundifolia]
MDLFFHDSSPIFLQPSLQIFLLSTETFCPNFLLSCSYFNIAPLDFHLIVYDSELTAGIRILLHIYVTYFFGLSYDVKIIRKISDWCFAKDGRTLILLAIIKTISSSYLGE